MCAHCLTSSLGSRRWDGKCCTKCSFSMRSNIFFRPKVRLIVGHRHVFQPVKSLISPEKQGHKLSLGPIESQTRKIAPWTHWSQIKWRRRGRTWLRCRSDGHSICGFCRVSFCWKGRSIFFWTQRKLTRSHQSTLMSKLTGTHSEVSEIDFTTLTTVPGTVKVHGAPIQILDLRKLILP